MVKLINPVHSDAASGTLARTTFGRGRGINYARLTVKPKNPQTPNQLAVRIAFLVIAEALKRMNAESVGKADGNDMTPKEFYQAEVKPPDVTNVHTRRGYRTGRTEFEADAAEYLSLAPAAQAEWNLI